MTGDGTSIWMNENEVHINELRRLTFCWRRLPSWGLICWALILESLKVKSMIRRSHGIWMNNMKEIMCYMLCVIWKCYVLCVIRWLYWCMSLSWHNFPNLILSSPLPWLPNIMFLGKRSSSSCMSLVCAFIYPYLVQVCTNSIQTSTFRSRHSGL